MSRITSIKPQKRPGWFNVWVDGGFAFSLSDVLLAKERLKVGKEVSSGWLTRWKGRSQDEKVWEKVLMFLSFRPRSEKEMKEWMERKGVETERSEQLFNRLKKEKWLNDEKFARWWVEQRVNFRPKGKRLLRAELKNKGVAEEVIEGVLSEAIDEGKGALEVAEKQLRRWGGVWDRKVKEKVMAALVRRGYSWDVVKKVVDGLAKKV